MADEKDVDTLQKILASLHLWDGSNNIRLNISEFELFRCGTNSRLQENICYRSYDGRLFETMTHLRYLGVTMINNVSFVAHISKITLSAVIKWNGS